MSTFDGFLDEIENVSIDRFTEENFKSKLFFLSHCHTDHMIGLKDVHEDNELPGPLYLSEISSVIVRRLYPAIKNLVVLNIGGKNLIKTTIHFNCCLFQSFISVLQKWFRFMCMAVEKRLQLRQYQLVIVQDL